MKNKLTKSESVFKKKGFYVALYSCVGVVLVLAATISFSNLNPGKEIGEPDQNPMVQETEPSAEVANKSTVTPLPTTTAVAQLPQVALGDTQRAIGEKEADGYELAQAKPELETEAAITPAENKVAGITQEAAAPLTEEKAVEHETAQLETARQEVVNKPASTLAEPVFKSFSAETDMNWPVLGEVVMDYSNDHAIFDKTLEQYRTNDNICIAAQVGTQVKASAEGVVKSVANSKETGNTVVIDHGNGWETTYSQLQENILVREGDVVKAGQVIGGVSSPSIYSVLLGNHLTFKVSKDNIEVDPKTVLAK